MPTPKKRKICVYKLRDKKTGAGLKIFLVPKKKQAHGVDGVELHYITKEDIQQRKSWHILAMKDWEALAISAGLTFALLYKKNK